VALENDQHQQEARVQLRGVSHIFTRKGTAVTATDNVNLDIHDQEFVALVGPSGCGKTTLLNMVAGLVHPSTGTVTVDGQSVTRPPKNLGFMFARDALMPWKTARANVEFSLAHSDLTKGERRDRVSEVLDSVGLQGFGDAHATQLSQGMRQRVAIARTLAPRPSLILMDEPFAALDAQTRALVQEEFLKLWESRRSTVILVTHDLAEAILLADRVVVMSARPGRIKHDIRVPFERPRAIESIRTDPQFEELYTTLWQSLREEFEHTAATKSNAKSESMVSA
jgi:NitT/TauT family transport system ATP-binding protein